MTIMTKLLAGGAGLAALMAAAPAAAQYAYGYQQPYAQPYGNAYGYQRNVTSMAAQQCAAAVQARLQYRGGYNNSGLGGVLGAVLGVRTPMATSGRVVSFTRVTPRRNDVRVTGLATSGQAAAYSPYGYGAYGSYGYAYQPDLSFSCRVDYRGRIRDVDINRRR